MRRREFVGIIGGAAVWALSAHAQSMPVVGYLSSRSESESGEIIAAFRRGLAEASFVDKQNVIIEARFAAGHFDRLPELAAELVRHPVDVLVATGGTVSVVKAKPVVPPNIPIVFAMGGDPVKLGIVESLARPGGNVTGVSFLVNGLAAKAIELLHDLLPHASILGLLVNPNDPNAVSDINETQRAVDSFGQTLVVGKVSTVGEIDTAFAMFAAAGVQALFVDTEPFLADQRDKLVALAARNRLPAVYQLRTFAVAGGLASYGTSITDANRQLGNYTARVLTGAKPAELPVIQSTRFELVINLKTAKMLELNIPQMLLARADEVIE
jgi:putative tryptophan/tyrosine transport system substrate-binding protein